MLKRKQKIAMLLLFLSVTGGVTDVQAKTIDEIQEEVYVKETEFIEIDKEILEIENAITEKSENLSHVQALIDEYSYKKANWYQSIEDSVNENYEIKDDMLEMERMLQDEYNLRMVSTVKFMDGISSNTENLAEPETLNIIQAELENLNESKEKLLEDVHALETQESEKKQRKEVLDAEIIQKNQELAQAIEDAKPKFEGIELLYSGEYNLGVKRLNTEDGVAYHDGHKETYYRQSEFPGYDLPIPGRHVADDGTIRDGEGYICVASDYSFYPKGSKLMTTLGPAKVYDTGCAYGVIDVYVTW